MHGIAVAIALWLLLATTVHSQQTDPTVAAQQEAEERAYQALRRIDPAAALPHLRRYLTLCQARGDRKAAVIVRQEIATALLCLGRLPQGEAELRRARDEKRSLPPPLDPIPNFPGGFAQWNLHRETVEYLLRERLPASSEELNFILEDFERIGDHYQVSQLPEEAVGYFREALRLRRRIRLPLPERPRPHWIERLARAQRDRGDLAGAAVLARQAIQEYQALGDGADAARAICERARIEIGRSERAQALLGQARRTILALPQKKCARGDPPWIDLWRARGDAAFHQRDYPQARRWHLLAYLGQYARGPAREVGQRAVEIARDYRAMGKLPQALHWLGVAADEFGSRDACPQWIDARLQASQCLEALGDIPEARRACDEAVRCFERMSFRMPRAVQAAQLEQRAHTSLYGHLARLLLRLHEPPEAVLRVLERGRGQALRRQSRFSERWLYQRANPRVKEEGRALRERGGGARGWLSEAYTAAALRLAFWRDHLWAENLPDTIAARVRAFAEEETRSQRAALASETLELTFTVVDEKETLALARDARSVQAFVLPIGRKALAPAVAAWRAALESPSGIREAMTERQWAQRLHALLLGSIVQAGFLEARRIRRLRLIADGPLANIPFAALMDSRGRRLIERFALAIPFPELAPTPTSAASGRALPALSVAKPSLPESLWPNLPQARAEADDIAALFPGTTLLTGRNANHAQVLARMPPARILHFATHAVSDPEQGLRAALFLTPDTRSDGRLEASDLLQMSLSAHLAVLSACESAGGQSAGGDAVIGLPWALRSAGCQQVAASLWKVDDATARQMVIGFLKFVRHGARCDEALRKVMLAVRKNTLTNRPFFWAAFQLYGDGGTLGARAPAAPRPARPFPSLAGERIVFLSRFRPDGTQDGVNRIYAVRPDGTQVRALTGAEHQNVWDPDLSWDGAKVIFVSTMRGNPDLYLLDLATGALQQVSDEDLDYRSSGDHRSFLKSRPRLAPNGRAITLSVVKGDPGKEESQIYGTAVPAPRGLGGIHLPSDGRSSAWSRDGLRLVFSRHREGNWDICDYTVTEPETHQRLAATSQDEDDPDCSPAEEGKIAFTRDMGGGNIDIFVRDFKVGEERRLTNHPGRDTHPRFSPDGKRIVFVSDRSGVEELWIVDATSGNEAGLRRLGVRGTSPSWR